VGRSSLGWKSSLLGSESNLLLHFSFSNRVEILLLVFCPSLTFQTSPSSSASTLNPFHTSSSHPILLSSRIKSFPNSAHFSIYIRISIPAPNFLPRPTLQHHRSRSSRIQTSPSLEPTHRRHAPSRSPLDLQFRLERTQGLRSFVPPLLLPLFLSSTNFRPLILVVLQSSSSSGLDSSSGGTRSTSSPSLLERVRTRLLMSTELRLGRRRSSWRM